jgi:hypothetical protein
MKLFQHFVASSIASAKLLTENFMRRHSGTIFFVFLAVSMLITSRVSAQSPYTSYGGWLTDQGMVTGGLGLSTIDGRTYFTTNFRPELAFGKFGIGLDVMLRFDSETGDLRTQDWDDSYDWFRILRYVRYGFKQNPDPVYTRLGALDNARLGHGFIMNYYNNQIIYDERKQGLEFDSDFGIGGFELMTSNLGRAEIFGGRLYYRPLQLVTNMPILKNFTIGATYVTDIDPDVNRSTENRVSVFGFDAELPIFRTDISKLAVYGDVAKIVDFGSGQAVGVEFQVFNLSGLVNFGAQLERRFIGKRFLPSYFGPFYEVDRSDPDSSRQAQLALQTTSARGTYGSLYGSILNTINLLGSYERIDGAPRSGLLHVQAAIPNTIPGFAARASYDDKGVDSFSDVFDMDENSAARVGLGYKMTTYLILYLDYIWTFQPDPARPGEYKVQRRFEPQLALSYTFPVGGGR